MTDTHKYTDDSNSKFLEKELSYKLIGCFYTVVNKYGNGLKEKVYENALVEEFVKQKINFEEQKRINIYSIDSGKVLGIYVPDFVVEGKIIVEIKAVEYLARNNIDQQRSYLKTSKYEIAFLVNFGAQKVEVKRSIYTNDRKPFICLLHF
jgi:GxxExxY protein